MLRSLAAAATLFAANSLSATEWKKRTTYQIVTDRFALGSNDKDLCGKNPDLGGEPRDCAYGAFCGGTFQGIESQLDYIQGMGFDAIYISPVVKNVPCGYHGYWTEDLWTVDPRFGGEEGLLQLVKGAHARGMAVMLDTVFNHMGAIHFTDMDNYPDASGATFYSDIRRLKAYKPFDQMDHYHGTLQTHMQAQQQGETQYQREFGWIGFVDGECPDLKHEMPFVHDNLMNWIKHMVNHYGFDAVRVDAAPYVPKWFLQELNNMLPDTYIVGEVVITGKGLAYAAGYQWTSPFPIKPEGWNNWEFKWNILQYDDPDIWYGNTTGTILDGVLNNPVLGMVRDTFGTKDGKTYNAKLDDTVNNMKDLLKAYKRPELLPVFVDNHDNGRWFHYSPDYRTYKAGMTLVFFMTGVPIAYYGMEQGMVGPGGFGTNASRYPMWLHGYDKSAPLYAWTRRAVLARQKMVKTLSESDPSADEMVDFKSSDGKIVSWRRGEAVIVLSRLPTEEVEPCVWIQTTLKGGQVACDELETEGVCLDVAEGGYICVPNDGVPMVLFPRAIKASEVALGEIQSPIVVRSFFSVLAGLAFIAVIVGLFRRARAGPGQLEEPALRYHLVA